MSQLLPFLQIDDVDYSWLAKFVSLIVLPFADEDFAIILGGYIVVNQLMPVGLVALCIYVGMVASDVAFYGIGVAARRAPWLKRLAVNDRVRSFADTLKRNVFEVVALCRVVPGLGYVAFVACGWTRVPLGWFTVSTLIVSALYLPLATPWMTMWGCGPGPSCSWLSRLLVSCAIASSVLVAGRRLPQRGRRACAIRKCSSGRD